MLGNFNWLFTVGIAGVFFISCGEGNPENQEPISYSNPTVFPYTEKIKLNPEDAEGYFERAQALANIQSDSLAIVDFKKALSIQGDNPNYLKRYADFLFEIKQFSEAANVYEQLYQIKNDDESTLLSLIQVYIRLNDVAKARQFLDEPLKELPKHPVLNYFLCEVLLVERDTVSALRKLDELINVNPQFYTAKLLKGEIQAAQLNPANVKELESTFRLDTLDVYPLERIGDYFFEVKDYAQALKYYKKSVTADLNYEYGFFKVGQVYFTIDSFEKAIQQYNLAIQSNVRYVEPYIAKGLAFEKLGKKDSAKYAYDMGLTFFPNNEQLLQGIKRVD